MDTSLLFVGGYLALVALLWLLFIPLGPVIAHGLAFLGNRTASFRYRDYAPVVVLLVGGAIGAGVAGDQFLDLAEHVQTASPTLQHVDTDVHEWARQQRSGAATLFFTFFTIVGTPVALGILVVIVTALLVMQGRYRWAAYLVVTTLVGSLLVVQLKIVFARERPDLAAALRSADGYSFPSGHAMGSTVVFLAFSYLILRAQAPWKKRALGLAIAAATIVAISVSRVYLGVHWISDIAAGITAGALWMTVATVAYEAFRRIRMIRSLRAKREAD